MNKIKIEIQHFHGCPNGPKMIDNVRTALKGLEDKTEYCEVLVEDGDTATNFGFRGSPTLLINGEDFEGLPKPENPGLTCRFYTSGVPSPEKIRKRIIEISGNA
ncbi:DUF2703 domain-containing protein [Bacteroidota bacterium]